MCKKMGERVMSIICDPWVITKLVGMLSSIGLCGERGDQWQQCFASATVMAAARDNVATRASSKRCGKA
jgi:hypothetical protein